MDIARPYAAVVPSLEGDVLVTLAGTRRPLTGREVARLTRTGSQTGIHRALQRLHEQGLVNAQQAGRVILFSLNREHVAAGAVELLSGLRSELIRRLKETLGGWEVRPVHASLYGSAARGDGDTKSDIDLFLVRPTRIAIDQPIWRAQVEDLAEKAHLWTGNRLSATEVSRSELAGLRRARPLIVTNLLREAITLAGAPAGRLFE